MISQEEGLAPESQVSGKICQPGVGLSWWSVWLACRKLQFHLKYQINQGDGVGLYSQHLGSRGRGITSQRSSSLPREFEISLALQESVL